MRILFAGTPEIAVEPLKRLQNEHEVVAVLTTPDAISGRGKKLKANPVKTYALSQNIRVITDSPTSGGFIDLLKSLDVEAAVVVAYGKILKPDVLDALPHGWINLHFSLLPQYRGAAPVQRAIFNGEPATGISVFQIAPGLDDGDIFQMQKVFIKENENTGELLNRLSYMGAKLLCDTINQIESGTAKKAPQPKCENLKKALKISKEDGHIVFEKYDAREIQRRVNACTPNPGAWCEFETPKKTARIGLLRVLSVKIVGKDLSSQSDIRLGDNEIEKLRDLKPGEILKTKKHLFIGCKKPNSDFLSESAGTDDEINSVVELLSVKPEGKKETEGAAFARGIQNAEKCSFL